MLKRIPLQELKPGMILGEDIFGKDALVLLTRGKVLEAKEIAFLQKKFANTDTKSIVIFIEDKTKPQQKEENIPLFKPGDHKKFFENMKLTDVQEFIKNIFSQKQDFQTTKRVIEILKRDISEAFDFLIINHEINDKKFLDLSNKIINLIDAEQHLVNPGYLYLIELEHWHPDTFNHSIDVAFFTLFIASQFTNDLGELSSLFIGGLLHDIGKYLRYKEGEEQFYEIITKIGPLTNEEFNILKKHVDVANFFEDKFRFLNNKERDNIMYAALDHHEKLDGSGYLLNKKGMQISLAGRIVAVADIYDALIRKREYKSMVKPDIAMRHIMELGSIGKLDKKFTSIFKKLLGVFPTGSVITTNRGMAIVVGQTEDPEKPRVMLIEHHELGEIDLRQQKDIEIYEEVE